MESNGTNPEIKYIREGEVKKLLKEKDAIIEDLKSQLKKSQERERKLKEALEKIGFDFCDGWLAGRISDHALKEVYPDEWVDEKLDQQEGDE